MQKIPGRQKRALFVHTLNSKDSTLNEAVRRLKSLPNDYFGKELATQSIAHTLAKRTDDSLKRDHLASFYVSWKLHKNFQ
jgi:hypothetical protein